MSWDQMFYKLKKLPKFKTAIIVTTDKVYLNLEKKKFKENDYLVD